ncbi:MAG TPA: hypothetical protein VEO54_09165 [Thermoanaerobaculia bacterium]|nr:hypothetical protein [Thermoanaerobaculia bacterium]
MPLFTPPPVPPTPPAIVRCISADGTVISDCAKYEYKRQQNSVSARFTGGVRIDLKSDDVVIVPANGTATIEERAGRTVRSFAVENGKTTYTVDGTARPFDAAARQWLRDVLSTMPARPVPPAKQ